MLRRFTHMSLLSATLVLVAGGDVVDTHHRCGHGNYDATHQEECAPDPPPDPDPPTWPPTCLPDATQRFGAGPVTTIPAPAGSMFGRPLAASQIPGGEIVLAVGSRVGQGTLHIYRLNPGTGSVTSGPVNVALSDIPQRLAVADFNADGVPDFVSAGFGPVEALISDGAGGYALQSIRGSGDGVAATNALVAVGDAGSGRRDAGEVFLYDVTNPPVSFSFSHSVTGPSGSKFGEAVGLDDVNANPSIDLVVGAPGIDGPGRKETDYGEASVFDGLTVDMGPFAQGAEKNDRLGWQVAVDGQTVLVASKWTSSTRRAEVYPDATNGSHFDLEPPSSHPTSLGDGWASGGIATGTVAGQRSALIGAPNANCNGSGSTGVAYLYNIEQQGLPSNQWVSPVVPEAFVPPVAVDPNGDSWNVFGWSNAIVETTVGSSKSSFVIIGEPGREATDVHDGQVYVYQFTGP